MEFGMDSKMERGALVQGYDAEHRIQGEGYRIQRIITWFQCSTLEPFCERSALEMG